MHRESMRVSLRCSEAIFASDPAWLNKRREPRLPTFRLCSGDGAGMWQLDGEKVLMRSDDPRRQSRLMVVRRLFKTLFVVPAPVAALCPFAIAVLMAWVFLSDNRHGPLA